MTGEEDAPLRACVNCKFGMFSPPDTSDNGECRRYAPYPSSRYALRRERRLAENAGDRLDNLHEVVWPPVAFADWCGEFVASGRRIAEIYLCFTDGA